MAAGKNLLISSIAWLRFRLLVPFLMGTPLLFSQPTVIRNGNLEILVNQQMQTRVSSNHPNSRPLMSGFSYSEYLETGSGRIARFDLSHKTVAAFEDETGKGTIFRCYGTNKTHRIEKILTIKIYPSLPDNAYYRVAYVNHSGRTIEVKKWVNNHYTLIPSANSPGFWSFQGSSHHDRRDWIRKINPGYCEKNFMGMNASDYGGGIPLVDLWRRDGGIAIGHTETVAKMVSLPVNYAAGSGHASIAIGYTYTKIHMLVPGDTLQTFETFAGVHQKDCFATLRSYAGYMKTKGIENAPSEPAAFEPVWCAWGYEKDFTVDQILNTLPKVKALRIKWVGLDDGFQQSEGDWNPNKVRFPGGEDQMKAFVARIHAEGMKAELWWAPLAVSPHSRFLKAHPDVLLKQHNGNPEFIGWWNDWYMAPTDSVVIAETKKTAELFLKDWDFDGLKLDGQHINACAPDYASGHSISRPEESFERLPLLFKEIYATAREMKPAAVVQLCPCGTCINFYHMPYTNQFVASDPESSRQVRVKGKVYKALMPQTAYAGDHVELTDDQSDFASSIGIGAVPETKFIWPATGIKSKDSCLLTPEREILFKKYLDLYREKMLSQGVYRGELYDIGYEYPEAHCIQKDDKMYYAFYSSGYSGNIELRGLDPAFNYRVTDYFHGIVLGTVGGSAARLPASFKKFLLLEIEKIP